MQKEIAAEILAIMLEYSGKLDQSVQRVKDTCNEQEFMAYRKAVGTVMGEMYMGVMWPIFKEHPDLEPEEMKPRNEQ